jgi:hypothetical protein
MAMDFDALLDALEKWRALGCTRFSSGTTYYGKPEPNEGKGWFHRVFAPIPKSDYEEFIAVNPYIAEFPYAKVLAKLNGANLFYDGLRLSGFHFGDSQESHDLPFDIVSENLEEWGKLAGPDRLIIGGANYGYRSVRYVEGTDGVVSAFEDNLMPIHSWKTFKDFFISEVDRLSDAYDSNGVVLVDLESSRYA